MTLFYNITTTPPFREPRTLTPPLTASSQTRTHSLHLRFCFASRSPPVANNTPPASTFLRSLSGRMADTRHCRLSFCPVKDKPGYCPPPVLVPASRTGLSARPALTPTYAHAATPADSWKLQGRHGAGQAWSCYCRVAPRRCVRGEDAWFKCVCFSLERDVPCGWMLILYSTRHDEVGGERVRRSRVALRVGTPIHGIAEMRGELLMNYRKLLECVLRNHLVKLNVRLAVSPKPTTSANELASRLHLLIIKTRHIAFL